MIPASRGCWVMNSERRFNTACIRAGALTHCKGDQSPHGQPEPECRHPSRSWGQWPVRAEARRGVPELALKVSFADGPIGCEECCASGGSGFVDRSYRDQRQRADFSGWRRLLAVPSPPAGSSVDLRRFLCALSRQFDGCPRNAVTRPGPGASPTSVGSMTAATKDTQ